MDMILFVMDGELSFLFLLPLPLCPSFTLNYFTIT